MQSGARPLTRRWRAALLGLLSLLALADVAQAQALPGRAMLLVASSGLKDPGFGRTVVLVTRHGRSPPIGVILNRPLDVTLSALFPGIQPPPKDLLYLGGPVAPQQLVYLFRPPDTAAAPADAIALGPSLYLSRDPTLLSSLLHGQRPHAGLRVFGGFAGWAPGQLEQEIQRGDWHLLPVDADELFRTGAPQLWPQLIERAEARAARGRNPVTLPLPGAAAPRFPNLPPLHSL